MGSSTSRKGFPHQIVAGGFQRQGLYENFNLGGAKVYGGVDVGDMG